MKKGKLLLVVLMVTSLVTTAFLPVAFASDHLANAAAAPGKDHRGFTHPVPVVGNPSGISAEKARPAGVPGEDNPNAGNDTGSPAVNCALLHPNSNASFCE
ncbi:MAG: hypothetical protein ACE5E0_06240 [Terriglobia bacterium]